MKVEVTNVSEPWKFNDTADPLYTIVLKDYGEPVKTYDLELAKLGEHEAEEYTAKSGKTYWRLVKQSKWLGGGTKKFEADPKKLQQEFSLEVAKNLSIQRQVSLKACVDLVVADKIAYTGLDATFDHLMLLLNPKYEAPSREEEEGSA